MPLSEPRGVASSRPARNPTTSSSSAEPSAAMTSSVCPTAARKPPTSTTMPTTFFTTPSGSCTGADAQRCSKEDKRDMVDASVLPREVRHQHVEARLDGLVHLAQVRLQRAAVAAERRIDE